MFDNFIIHQGFGFDPVQVFQLNHLQAFFDQPPIKPNPAQAYLKDIAQLFQSPQHFYQATHVTIESAIDYDDNIGIFYQQDDYPQWQLVDGPKQAIYLPNPDVIISSVIDPLYSYDGAIHTLSSVILNLASFYNIEYHQTDALNVIENYLKFYDDHSIKTREDRPFSTFQVIQQRKDVNHAV